MGQTTRSEWESDMRAHRELLRNVIEEHREGRDGAMNWGEVLDDLALPEEIVYAPTSTLAGANPPMMAQGPSGWIYHSTSLGCLRPHHFPRRLAINIVESPIFDPLILLTIMCNCTTMAWQSPLDPPGTWKMEFLAVRPHPQNTRHPNPPRPGKKSCAHARARARPAAAAMRPWHTCRNLTTSHSPPRRRLITLCVRLVCPRWLSGSTCTSSHLSW